MSFSPLLGNPKPQYFDSNGVPLVAGTIDFYAGGTSTPLDTFTSFAGTTTNTNPIVLNARGEVPSQVYGTDGVSYKAVLKDSSGAVIWTQDVIYTADTVKADLADTANGKGASLVSIKDAAGNFTLVGATDVEAALAVLTNRTTVTKTWYVNPSTGDDSTGTGLIGAPFKTIQKAYDSIPFYIFHQQTIQLADGTYNTNYISSAQSVELPRAAILFGRGKFISARTQKNGSDLEGGLIIKGNSTTPTDVIIEPGDTYSYGIYNSQGQIGLQDFIIRTGVAATNVDNLLTSHRMDSYVHSLNVSIDGFAKGVTSRGIVTESGGQMEFTTTTTATIIDNCAILVGTLGPGENITISGQITIDAGDTGLHANKNSKITFVASGLSGQTITNCTTNCITVIDGAYVGFTGKDDSNHITVTGTCKIENNAVLELIWTDINGVVSVRNSAVIKFNNSDYQDQLVLENAQAWFSNSNSYISPATANTNATPVICRDGATIHEDGTNDFNGSGGASLSARDVTELTVSANGETITAPSELNAVLRLNAGANRTSCVLAAGRYQWQTLEIFGFAGFSVQLIESTTATISNDTVKISGLSAADEYQGIKFIWRGTRWYEMFRSRAGS